MKVGWLADAGNADGTVGGAEITQQEFRAAAPKGVEVIDCPPGEVRPGLDAYVAHNIVSYRPEDIWGIQGSRLVKYMHDVWPHGDLTVKADVLRHAKLVFCSPLQRDHMGLEGDLIPPPVNLTKFRQASNGSREGAVSIGAWQNPMKGQQSLLEYAKANDGLDVYGVGQFAPTQPPLDYKGPLEQRDVPKTLASYATFVHLPWALEPFGRCVVEAWAAGLKLVVNGFVGATYWIQEQPDKLETAATDFWAVVLDA